MMGKFKSKVNTYAFPNSILGHLSTLTTTITTAKATTTTKLNSKKTSEVK